MAKRSSGSSSVVRPARGQSPPDFTTDHRLKLEGMIYGGFGTIYPERALVIAAALGEIDRLEALLLSQGETVAQEVLSKDGSDDGIVSARV